MVEVSFGEWLKRRRKGMGLTQQQLAAKINYSAIALKKIEAEERRPSVRVVERLAEIFNIPSNERMAFLRFAQGDWKSAPSEVIQDVPWRIIWSAPRSNLPSALTSLIGREYELTILGEYLSDPDKRLITLIGPPGIGKTRLSIEVARAALPDFPDGVFFVALAPLEDQNLVAPTISQTLGFVEATDQSPLKRLENGIGDKQMLIVLDNAEHLIQEIATLVSKLLLVCPRLKILLTSREALRVPGEWVYPVPTLSIPAETVLLSIDTKTAIQFASLSLFAERARAVRPDFTLNAENIRPVASICRQLDGLPLAIELIAARIRLMSPQSLLSNLSNQFTLYVDGMRAVPTRQKTLHNAISWSYHLLSTEEQNLFARLSVFAGGWSLEAVKSVCSGDGLESDQILDLLLHLVDKSLVVAETQGAETRYHMLETIRQYAREKLWTAGEGEMMRQRHLAYFVDLAERAEPNLRAFDMVMWLDRLEAELDNIRVALECAQESDVEAQLRLASALMWFCHIRGHRYEGIDWLEQGLSIASIERGDQPLMPHRAMIRGKALYASGNLMGEANIGKATERLEAALDLFKELGPAGKQGMAYALLAVSGWRRQAITFTARKSMVAQSLALFAELGDKFGAAQCLMSLSAYAGVEGDFERAKALGQEQLALREEIGDKDRSAIARQHLGIIALRAGNYQQARELYEESLAGFLDVGNTWGFGHGLSWLSRAALAQGNYEQATRTSEEALAIGQSLGDKSFIGGRLDELGKIAWAQGDYELAEERFDEALRISREVGNKIATASVLQSLGQLAQSREDFATARWFYSEAIALSQEGSHSLLVASHLAAFATLIAAQKQPEKAARLFGTVETLVASIRLEMPFAERAEYDRAIADTRNALGVEGFAAAWAEGRAMTMEQAITYALEDSDG